MRDSGLLGFLVWVLEKPGPGFLGAEPELRDLFECIYGGFEKRDEIAERLGIKVQAVTNASKRLDRRLDEFGAGHSEHLRELLRR